MNNHAVKRKLITWGPVSPLPFYRHMSPFSPESGDDAVTTSSRSMELPLLLTWDPSLNLQPQQAEPQAERSPLSPCLDAQHEDVMMDVEQTTQVVTPAGAPATAMPSAGDCFVQAFLTLEDLHAEAELTEDQLNKLVSRRGQELLLSAEKEAAGMHRDAVRRKRSLAQTIDETLSNNVEAHKQATSLRMAFEDEAAKVRDDVQQNLRSIASNKSDRPRLQYKPQQRPVDPEHSMEFVYDLDEYDGESQEPRAPPSSARTTIALPSALQSPTAQTAVPEDATPPSKRSRPFVPFVSPVKGSEK